MGSITFDFLTDSFLFKQHHLENSFAKFSDKQILQELDKYRDFCLNNLAELEKEITSKQSNLKVFADVDIPEIKLLKQSVLYVEQYVIDDPLFSFGYQKSDLAKSLNYSFGIVEKSFEKEKLCDIIRYLKSLTPMVAADYVKFLPISYAFEPEEDLPILYSEKLFSDILPEPIIEFFQKYLVSSTQLNA